MINLPDLPMEVQQQIVQETIPADFESFVLSCKSVYQAANGGLLEQYNWFRRKLRFIQIQPDVEDPGDDDSEGGSLDPMKAETPWSESSLNLLEYIAEYPCVARWIEFLDLTEDRPLEDDAKIALMRNRLDREDVGVKGLVLGSSFLQEAGVDAQGWYSQMVGLAKRGLYDTERHYCSSLFLLTLLPSLKGLALPSAWSSIGKPSDAEYQDAWRILDLIVRKANEQPNSDAPLSRLEQLELVPSEVCGYDEREKLQVVAPFASIKTVTRLYAGSGIATDEYTGYPFESRYDTFGINLRTVEMYGCCVGAPEMKLFLAHMCNLKNLLFSHEVKWQGCGSDWDYAEFMSAIEESPCAATLESLSVTICNGSPLRIDLQVRSVKGFRSLKSLELDLDLLKSRNSKPVPRLVDLVPDTVEVFRIQGHNLQDSIDDLRELFAGCVEGKDQHLPNLKKVYLRSGGNPRGGDQLQEAIGRELEAVNGRLIQRNWPLTAVWMKTFHERLISSVADAADDESSGGD